MPFRSRIPRILASAAALVVALPMFAFAAPSPRVISGELIVRYKPSVTASERANFRARATGSLVRAYRTNGLEHLKLHGMSTEAALRRFANDPDVQYVEPNWEISLDALPNDPRFPELYGMRNTGQTGGTPGADIRAANAWDVFTGDPNLKIGIIDTGVDYNHPDLAANVWTNPGEIPGNTIDDDLNGYVDDVHGYDFVNNDGDPFDDNGHGSHCAGTIAGVGDNNVGVTGVNWNAKVVGIKFLSGSGSGSTAGAIAGVEYAIAVGCRLTSNSWGGGAFSQALLDVINEAGAAGQLFVAAAGNSSANTDVSPHYPSSYNSPYIIAVAATDHNDNLASFSNFGATTVDLAAPGVNILSCQPGGGYQLLSGTSMATPHVAGVVGLAMGRFPAAANLFIKQLILNSADVKPQLAGKVLTGARLNAFLAIADPDETSPGAISDLNVTESGSSHIRLAWTATGDDGNVGRASAYDLRYSTSPIVDDATFATATPAAGPDPLPAGQAETTEVGGLTHSTFYHFAIKALDEFGNAGALSNVATGATAGPPDLAASPTSFSATLLTGAAETQTLTLSNVGQGTLDYSIPTPELMFSQPVIYEYVPLAKGEDDVRIGLPVVDGNGGPDGFGYRWIDSNEPNGPTFAWEDITGTGTLASINDDDETSAAIPIGFDFPFYGGSFSSVRVCTNGWLSFTSSATAYENQPLPNSGAPENLVAAFWDDLDFGTPQRVYTYGDAGHFVVSWIAVPHYQAPGDPPGGPYTFQAILYPSGEIRFQYQSMAAPTNSATVGIQNAAKNIGLTTAFNTSYAANNLAVRIVPLTQWLTVSPTSGRIPAGQSHNLNVQFNALGVDGGIFDGTIRVLNNDPDENPTELSAQLHVIGAPDIALSPDPVDFGTFFVGADPTRTLIVSNPGTDAVIVSDIASSDPDVHPDITAFTLNPKQVRNVILTFSPATARTLAGTVTVSSNDPDTPNASVNVVGASTPAPVVLASPESFEETLLTNTTASRQLRLTNTGGSNYNFTAAAEILGQSGAVTVFGDADNVDLPKDAPDTQFGPEPLASGGPDTFGYTFQDSDAPGGPTFAWVDISATGTPIPLNGDDQNLGPFPMGFSFPHYGVGFSSFRVTSNGWLTLNATNTQTTFTNTALPNSGSTVPPSLFAAFWDDLDFRPTLAPNARAYYLYDGTRTIVQYKGVPRRNESGTTAMNDFEVIFYPTGEVVYQYLTMNAVLKNSATIGMQNATKNDGLQVNFNANYVKNDLAIRFRPPARFLTVNPPSGTIAPGAFLDLTVGFNAGGLFGGTYDGQVRIAGNDPVRPQVLVPATLHVTGVPDIGTNPGAIAFGNVFTGFPQLRELRILNTGTDALVVSDVVSSDPSFGVDQTAFTVPPLGQALLLVTFNPATADPYAATLTISSNDPDSPTSLVTLSGTGVVAPDVDPQPAAITETLAIPAGSTQTLTLQNLGGSDLNFVVGTLLTASSVPIYEALDLDKEEPDPRPGVLGNGGPDLFGYRWIDSDDPGGPAFDWVDITAIGTPVPFTSNDDNNVQSIPIGFNFPFYGNSFSTVNICTNGWISFTNTTTDLSNDPLPNASAPENLIAIFWDDLLPGMSPARVFRYNDGTRFIVSWVAVPRLGSGGPYTFQAILYPSGRVVCQYLDMQGTRLNEATVGIQNAAKNDGLTVVHNANYVHNGLAVQFATVPEYMTVSPSSGTVPAGGSTALQVQFDTDGLFGGVYNGAIRVASNDPDETVLLVPTQLTALGTPNLAAQPAAVDFGSVYVGLTADRSVTLRNVGSAPLTISGLSPDHPDWALVGAPSLPATLGQNGGLAVTLRWTPSGPCSPCTGNLTVSSDDPDAPTLLVPLSGIGQIPPEIAVNPASLQAALATTLGPSALTTTKKLVVTNSGGSDLAWSAEALTALPAIIVGPDAEGPKDDPGAPGALGNGGPDAFGYRWLDSDDPDGPAFDWIDITGVGTAIPFTGDDQNQGPIALPFPFTFYGNTFNSVRVCTNGWLSFSSTATAFTNTALPSGGTAAPVNLVAPFWDDLTFGAAGDAYYHYDGSKFIVSWVAVPRLGTGGGPYTFQALLYPSGTIDFQYLDMQGTRLNEATVGIQNATRDVGLQVVFNAAYVKNNLRVRIGRQPAWLSVAPVNGITPAGESDTLTVTFNAAGLADGDYTGSVRVHSNDLDEPLVTVPAGLHVGVTAAKLRMNPGTFNQTAQGQYAEARVWSPMGTDAHLIVQASLLLQRAVHAAPIAPLYYEDTSVPVSSWRWSAYYKFNRAELLGVLPEGLKVPVEVIGRLADLTWFQAWDTVRVMRPRVALGGAAAGTPNDDPMPAMVQSSTPVPLVLIDPVGAAATAFELWYSPDAGETWQVIEQNITSHEYAWMAPEEATEQALLGVVAFDELGLMGSRVTNVFEIIHGTTDVGRDGIPGSFALRFAGRHPSDRATLELGMPVSGEASVRVYDVRGALVREVARGPYEAGWHRVTWDGSDAAGSRVEPGMYFVQAHANGRRMLQRFVLLK